MNKPTKSWTCRIPVNPVLLGWSMFSVALAFENGFTAGFGTFGIGLAAYGVLTHFAKWIEKI